MADLDFRSENGLVVNNNLIFAMGNSGRVGICTNAPQANLDVNGTFRAFGNTTIGQNVDIGGTLNVKAATTIQAPLTTTSYAIIGGQLDVKGNENVSGILTVAGNINAQESLAVSLDLSVGGKLTLNGPVIFNNNLNVAGNATVGGTLTVSGYTTIDDDLLVTGTATIQKSTSIGGALTVTGGGLDVAGATIIRQGATIQGSCAIGGSATVGTTFYCYTLGVGTQSYGGAGEIRATNDITGFFASDANLKENMTPIKNARDKILSLTGYEFDWKDDHIESRGGEDGYFVYKHDVGVSAQELEKVVPELVRTRPNGTKAVKYAQLVALMIEGYKEQQKEINELKARLK